MLWGFIMGMTVNGGTSYRARCRKLVKNVGGRWEIDIDEETWSWLNRDYDKEQIKEMISDAIDIFDIPPPYRHHTFEDMVDSFNSLVALDSSTLINDGPFFSRYPYKAKKLDLHIGLSNVGGKASDYFHQTTR